MVMALNMFTETLSAKSFSFDIRVRNEGKWGARFASAIKRKSELIFFFAFFLFVTNS